ncbi:KAP NTPase domain-containing protein [Vibrio chagasii]|nr:KAP NTPase domain-containing protein [Vibrio chagasii]CAH7105757.1 KAP NTPase domain-containing protein [Vibrio chagasii]
MFDIHFNNRDEFNRQSIAINIINLLESDISISPLIIDGGWGTGKTEFCCKLINLYKEKDSSSIIYIDAYKSDHADEPLLTILAEVLKLVPEKDGKRQKTINKILPAIRFGLKTSLKAGVGHLLKTDAADIAEGFEKEVAQATDAAIDASVESILKSHIEAEESLAALQQVLKKLSSEKPITIFIDELDRCKPSYAIKLLEVIKHTFNVPNVKFVLVTNSKQLEASIEHCYGNGVDASKYLDKFINYKIALPTTQKTNYAIDTNKVSSVHYKNLIKSSLTLGDTCLRGQYSEQFTNLVTRAISVHSLSLREVETLVRHIEVLNIVTPDYLSENKIFGYSMLHITGILFSVITPQVARKIHSRSVTAEEIGTLYGLTAIPELSENQWESPEHYEIFTALIAQECSSKESFTIDGEDETRWEHLFNRMFGRGWDKPDKTIEILASIIDSMHLYKA